jgi:hypothetical protein
MMFYGIYKLNELMIFYIMKCLFLILTYCKVDFDIHLSLRINHRNLQIRF